jgi:hypothetical protein
MAQRRWLSLTSPGQARHVLTERSGPPALACCDSLAMVSDIPGMLVVELVP